MNNYILFWFVISIFFLIIEIGSPGLFYFLSFSCASLIAAISGFFCSSIFDQMIVFLIGTVGSFFLLTLLVKRAQEGHHFRSNMYALQGKTAIVITPVIDNQFGYVQVDGQRWAYTSKGDKPLAVGSIVQILEVRGAHVIVEEKI